MKAVEQKAYSIIKERKRAAETNAASIKEELRKDSLYKSLESEYDLLCFEIAKLNSQNKDTSDLKQSASDINSKLKKRLAELGKNENDLHPKYTCNLCKDTGMSMDKDCECFNRLKTQLLQEQIGCVISESTDFLKAIKGINVKDKEGYKNCYGTLHEFTQNYPNYKNNIIGILGTVGTGKSYAASIAANILINKGYPVLMINSQKMNDLFLRHYLAPIESKNEVLLPLLEPDLLIIDDLGTENILNNITKQYIYSLLNERQDKFTMITSNYTVEELEDRYGQRIYSRLTDKNRSVFCTLIGEDLRKSVTD